MQLNVSCSGVFLLFCSLHYSDTNHLSSIHLYSIGIEPVKCWKSICKFSLNSGMFLNSSCKISCFPYELRCSHWCLQLDTPQLIFIALWQSYSNNHLHVPFSSTIISCIFIVLFWNVSLISRQRTVFAELLLHTEHGTELFCCWKSLISDYI